MNQDLSNNNFTLTQLVKVNASNMPIQQRINSKELDSLIKRELSMKGVNTPVGYAVYDKNNKLTKVANNNFLAQPDKEHYTFELFTDNQYKTLYTLALTFPNKDYSLVRNNMPMLLGTMLSLLTILGIYIISINYMSRQKKISEVKQTSSTICRMSLKLRLRRYLLLPILLTMIKLRPTRRKSNTTPVLSNRKTSG